jgi:(p)ppGpp synthase/HD superfamily hydrolase
MELVQKYKGASSHIDELKCAALLHDTLEDTDTNYAEIERHFGPLVASIVVELTSDPIAIKKMGKNKYLMEKMIKMSRYAFVLKLLDRLSNIMDNPGEAYVVKTLKMMKYLREHRVDLTDRQERIITKIEEECTLFIEGV